VPLRLAVTKIRDDSRSDIDDEHFTPELEPSRTFAASGRHASVSARDHSSREATSDAEALRYDLSSTCGSSSLESAQPQSAGAAVRPPEPWSWDPERRSSTRLEAFVLRALKMVESAHESPPLGHSPNIASLCETYETGASRPQGRATLSASPHKHTSSGSRVPKNALAEVTTTFWPDDELDLAPTERRVKRLLTRAGVQKASRCSHAREDG